MRARNQTPDRRTASLLQKPVIKAKKNDEPAEEDEEEEQEAVSEEEDEEQEEEDMDEDEDEEGRISFVDSTRVKTGRDLQSGNNHFFTRILFAARKQVVNSSAFRFLAEVSPDPSNPIFSKT
jgi:hypothetical protein